MRQPTTVTTSLPAPAAGKSAIDACSREAQLAGYIAPVYRLCVRLLRDSHAAEDAVQESFLDAIAIWDRFEVPADANANGKLPDTRLCWLLAIAARRALKIRSARGRQHARMEANMERLENTVSPTGSSPAEEAERHEALARVDRALDELPNDQREVVLLHHFHGLSQAEIARSLEAHPREISRRIQDSLVALRRHVAGHGVPDTLALLPFLTHFPAPLAPAGLTAQVLSHPTILAWTGSTSAAATASTAVAGGTASASGSAAHLGGLAASSASTTTKGATSMSSKFFVGMGATVLAAACLAWTFGALDPASVNRPTQTPSPRGDSTQVAGAQDRAITAVDHPADRPALTPAPATSVSPIAGGATPSLPVTPPTADQREAAYVKLLTGEQAARRAAFARAFSAPLDPHSAADMIENTWADVNTSVGVFAGDELTTNVSRVYRWKLKSVAEGELPAFNWDLVCIDQNWTASTENVDTKCWMTRLDATAFGRRIVFVNFDGTLELAPDSVLQPLPPDDVWPEGQPARYDLKSVGDRVGLVLTGPGKVPDLLQAAETADRQFLVALQAFVAAKAAHDPAMEAKAGANSWAALDSLFKTRRDVCRALADLLRQVDGSDVNGYATLVVSGRRLDPFNPSVAAQPAPLRLPQAVWEGDAPIPVMTQDHLYRLEMRGGTLRRLTYLFAKNKGVHDFSLSVDPAVAHITLDGRFVSATFEGLFKSVAEAAQVDCQPNGANGWKLVAKPDATKPAVDGGF